MILLDYRDGRPLYQQVKDDLRRMMLTGLLPPDEKRHQCGALPRSCHQSQHHPAGIQRAGGRGIYLLRGGQGQLCRRRGRRKACGASGS